MKKKILIPVSMAAMFLCASWQAAETTVSPDRLFWQTTRNPCL